MSTVPSIRRAKAADAAALAALAERTFRTTFAAFNTRENMDAHCANTYGEVLQAREIDAPNVQTYVGEQRGELVAYAQLRWKVAPPCVEASRPAELQRLYVDHAWHGRGVAQMLMREVLAAAARGGADRIWLGVWEHNPRAIAFYEKIGFRRVGQHIFQVGDDPQQDWVLCRNVAS